MTEFRSFVYAVITRRSTGTPSVRMSIPIEFTGYTVPKWAFFTDIEVAGLDNELVARLDTARKVAGVPFRITSGLRTCAANEAAMGVESSSHIKGLAVDLAVSDSVSRFAILKGLIDAGFVRIGVYEKHCHADVDLSKPQKVIWTGISH